jgi:hypothetical protein
MKHIRIAANASLIAIILAAALTIAAPSARAQGSRKDDIAFTASGHPAAGATVTVCTASATGTPCSPLATIYTDATLSIPTPNPFTADGLGNYHFYASPGRYIVQISGTGINTYSMKDVILPNDPSTPSFNSVTATSIALGGNLTVGGNASVSGTLNAGTFNPATISTSAMTVTGNVVMNGPRPWIDVTAPAYGAKGDGVTDDTAAIQSALTAACANSTGGGGTVYFPPTLNTGGYGTYYKVLYSSTSNPIFTVNCAITLLGGSSYMGTSQQFSRQPQTRILAGGTTADLGPVFKFVGNGPSSGIFVKDLTINGENQAVQVYNDGLVRFENTCLVVNNTGQSLGGTTDNTPLAIYATFWLEYKGGCLVQGATTTANTPIAVMSFVSGAGVQPNLGLIKFENTIGSGGGFVIDCRGNCPSGGGNFYWDNVQSENNSGMPFLELLNTNGATEQITQIEMRNVANYDCSNPATGFFVMNAPNVILQQVFMSNASPCNGGGAPVLQVVAGSIQQVFGLSSFQAPQNSSGAYVGNATWQHAQGFTYVTSGAASESQAQLGLFNCCGSGAARGINNPPITLALSGGNIASMGISPKYGVQWSDSSHPGFQAAFNQAASSPDTLDLQFAQALAPAGITATPTTGGTLAAATYYYSIASYTASTFLESAASNEVTCTLSGSNNACAIAWTAPAGTNEAGCYIFRSTSANGTYNASPSPYYQISNCSSTTTFTDTGATPTGSGSAPTSNASMKAFYHFAANSSNPGGGNVPYYAGTPVSGDAVSWGASGALVDSGAQPIAGATGITNFTFSGATHEAASVNGSTVTNDCAKWDASGNIVDAGSACGSGGGGGTITAYTPPVSAGNVAAPSAANAINVVAFLLPAQVQFSHITVDVNTADTTSGSLCGSFADCYDVGLYDTSGNLKCNWGATAVSGTGLKTVSCAQGTVTLAAGYYVFAWTGNATTAKIFFGASGSGAFAILGSATSSTSSSSGALPSTISVPTFATSPNLSNTYAMPFLYLY